MRKIGIEKSIKSIEDANIILALFDNSEKISNEDRKILELINSVSDKTVIKDFK